MLKISILGDVMSEPGLLRDTNQADGTYCYDPVFAPLKALLSQSDLVLANLETPVAGEALGYSESIYSFNAPDALVKALQAIGVDAVSTANNHAMDRGGAGFYATLDTLDRLGMPHTGTFRPGETADRNLYLTAGDLTVAVIAYTYGVNGIISSGEKDGVAADQINLLMVPEDKTPPPSSPKLKATVNLIQELTGYTMKWEDKIRLKSAMGIPIAYADEAFNQGSADKQLSLVQRDVKEAKKKADLVLFLPHVGGQFNTEPGAFTRYVVQKAREFGCDAVLAGHAHTTQRAEWQGDCPVYYSLGNVSMSSRTVYSQHQTLPQYGIISHLYVEEKRIVRSSYSLFCIVEEENRPMRVVPVCDRYAALTDPGEKQLFLEELTRVTQRISGFSAAGEEVLREEYDL
ncbi:MAG: CapA family protein [Clostridia bacterium]|nr:CapA family protein [Clostridia bacterium]